jgi:hypothetical protein
MREPKEKIAQSATDKPTGHEPEKNPQQPKPQHINLTPEEPVNIGFVGGVRMPKTKE